MVDLAYFGKSYTDDVFGFSLHGRNYTLAKGTLLVNVTNYNFMLILPNWESS